MQRRTTRLALVAIVAALVAVVVWRTRAADDGDRSGRDESAAGPGPAPATLSGSPRPASPSTSTGSAAPVEPPHAEPPARAPALVSVVLPDGGPAGGALVAYAAPNASRAAGVEDRGARTVRANAEGVAELPIPSEFPDGRVHVAARSEDGRLVGRESLDLAPGGRGVVRLGAAAKVEGRVVASPPADGLYVLAYSQEWPEAPGSRRIAVAADGSFTVDGVAGRVNLVAYGEGRAPSAFWKGNLAPGETAHADLVLGGRAVSRRLRLVVGGAADAGPPRAGTALLYTSVASAWTGGVTDAQGLVVLEHVDPAAATKVVVYETQDASGTPVSMRTEASIEPSSWRGDEPLVLALGPALGGALELVDDRGAAVPGYRVVLVAEVPNQPPTAAAATSDEAGRVDLAKTSKPLPSARLHVATLAGKELWAGDPPGAGKSVRVALAGLRPVTLRLVDWDGRPTTAPWIGVRLVQPVDGRDLDEEADPKVIDLSPATWTPFDGRSTVTLAFDPTVTPDPFVRFRVRLVSSAAVDRGTGRPIELRLPRECGVVALRATHASGHPIPTILEATNVADAAVVYAAKVEGVEPKDVVGLLPGRYRWRARRSGALEWERSGEVDVVAGRRVDLVVGW